MKYQFDSKLQLLYTNILDHDAPSFNRHHIFEDIKAILKKNASPMEIISLIYSFDQYEKCLRRLIQDPITLTEPYVKAATEEFDKMSDNVKESASILYYPMVAYYHYVNSDFEKALQYIKTAISYGDRFLESNPVVRAEFYMEQTINIFRIHVKSKDHEKSVEVATQLIDYITVDYSDIMPVPFNDIVQHNEALADSWRKYVYQIISKKNLNQTLAA